MDASTLSRDVHRVESPAPLARPAHRQGADIALYGIYEISKLLNEPAPLEATLAGVLQVLSSFLDVRHALFALLGETGNPEVVVGSGCSEDGAKRYFERIPERAIGCIVATGMPLVVADIRDEPLFAGSNFSDSESSQGEVAFIGVAVKDRGKVTGTLTIDRERCGQPYFRIDQDVRFLSMVANLVGQAVRLQRLIARDRERLLEDRNRLEKSIESAAPPIQDRTDELSGIVGESAAIREVLDKVRIVARSHSTVLLRGESGTGKELFARALHNLSPRHKRAFVSVNCAALPEGVLESELFGHERGAFTGAISTRKGRFELADGGTLFLDEIGEISASFQAKLLRVLQEGEFQRVGGNANLKVNVRFVAATNRDLEEAVSKGEFRADLYYRISVVPIFLPPLRERPSDIPPLAAEFLQRFNREHGANLSLSDGAIDVLTSCRFPGNVRELENCLRRTATLAAGLVLTDSDFACRRNECLSSVLWRSPHAPLTSYIPLPIVSAPPALPDAPAEGLGDAKPGPASESAPLSEPPAPPPSESDERGRLIQAMESAGWVQAKAARVLGISARQIGYALRKHEISIRKF